MKKLGKLKKIKIKKIRNEKLKILVVIQLHKKAKEKKENTRCSPACSLITQFKSLIATLS